VQIILPCLPDPTDILVQDETIGDSSAMDWQLALAKSVPVSDIPALLQLIQGEVIGDYTMTGFPVPRALIGQHPWYGLKPRTLQPMRQAGGRLEMVVIGAPPLSYRDVFAILVERTEAWLTQYMDIDRIGMLSMVWHQDPIGAPEAIASFMLDTHAVEVEPPLTLPRGAIWRSGLAKWHTSVNLPPDFGVHDQEGFVESTMRWFVAGVTRDSASAPLASCTVTLMRSDQVNISQDVFGNPVEQVTVSDGAGAYEFQVPTNVPHQLTGYKVGAPDVAGITRNDVIPTERG
jgi:hypothetical protein